MSDSSPPPKPEPKPAPERKPSDAPSKGDMAALGIGCLVVLIFLIAIIAVGTTRE